MGIDVKEIRDSTIEAEETMADAATGAIATAVDAATHPGRTMRRLERRGEPVNRSLRRQANRTAEDIQEAAVDVVSGNLAERITLAGIRMAKSRARRKDVIGDVLSAGLSVLHRGLSATAHEVGKFERATEPPSRPGPRKTSPARRSSSRSTSRSTRSRRSTGRGRS